MRGRGFLGIIFVFLGLTVLTVGLGALFAVTADSSGFVRLLPLLAFFALLIVGTAFLVRKALK